MKRIEAIIRPHKQAAVLVALAKVGITNVTVIETLGLARHKTFSRTYEPASPNDETQTGLIPKRLLLMFVDDQQAQMVADLIQPIAITGEPGDGIIAISPLDQTIRIRPQTD
jgi:nitrogen regulatory protein P-II 1